MRKYGAKGGALFNGRIEESVAEVVASSFEVGTTTFGVHRVVNDSGSFVGLEIRQRSTGSARLDGVPLSDDEARSLGQLLLVAVSTLDAERAVHDTASEGKAQR